MPEEISNILLKEDIAKVFKSFQTWDEVASDVYSFIKKFKII